MKIYASYPYQYLQNFINIQENLERALIIWEKIGFL